MIEKSTSAIFILKIYLQQVLQIFLVFMTMFNFGCAYEHTHAAGTIEVHFETNNEALFILAVKEFSEKSKLNLANGTRGYPSGAKAILLQLTTENGDEILKVNDYMDGRRFVVSAYQNKKRDWKPVFDEFFKFLSERFPNAKIEKKLA